MIALAGSLFAQLPRTEAPEEIDSLLRSRIDGFYGHFQKGQFRQAEDFLDEESKDLFYNAKKTRVLSYHIESIRYSDDFRSASALVGCQTNVPMLGSAPMTVPLSSNWHFVDGDWKMHLAAPKQTDGAVVSPFGTMKFDTDPDAAAARGASNTARPTLDSLRSMFEVDRDNLSFPSDKPHSETVVVGNLSPGKLSVELARAVSGGLELEFDEQPASQGEPFKVTIHYDPEKGKLNGLQRVDLIVIPFSQIIPLSLTFQ